MLFDNNINNKALFRLALAGFLLAIVVVVLGAFTRLVDAGLGCPDWPGCYGHLLWPNDAVEIAKAEKAFPGTPVELDKTWPEMVHRYFAGALGLLILFIAVATFRASRTPRVFSGHSAPVKLSVFLLCLVILQAAFGMWTVTLKLWPKVVTAHLLGGFATLSLLWLLTQRLGGIRWAISFVPGHIKVFGLFAMLAVILQIALGGWVSSNYAALACPDLPQCLGQWMPQADFKEGFNFQAIGPNYLGGELDNMARTAIHFSHRVGALVVTLVLIIFGFMLFNLKYADARRWAIVMWGVLVLQILLGLSNVYFSLPLAVAVAHNAIGALLLIVLVTINFKLITAKTNVL